MTDKDLFAVATMAIALQLLGACSSPQEAPPAITVTDSAGVQIVRNPDPQGVDSTSLSIEPVPFVSIGSASGEAPYLFNKIVGATRLSDGRIAVADGTAEIRFFDSTGLFLHKTGRRGDGPGEYQNLSAMLRHAGDSLLVHDFTERRVIGVHDAQGVFLRRVPVQFGDSTLNPSGDAAPQHVFGS